MDSYCIFGDITDSYGAPVNGYTVEITGEPGRFPQPMYQAVTDANGRYARSFDYWTAVDMFKDNAGTFYNPSLITITVRNPEGQVVGSRDYYLSWYGFAHCCEPIDVSIVDIIEPDDPQNDCVCPGECAQFHVYGWLRGADGRGVSGKFVHIYEQKFREKVLLATAVTSPQGNYVAAYEPSDPSSSPGQPGEGPNISIIVEAREPGDPETSELIACSPLIGTPGCQRAVYLYTEDAEQAPAIEYVVLQETVAPHMAGVDIEQMTPDAFSVDQLPMLSCVTGLSLQEIAPFLDAAKGAAIWRSDYGGDQSRVSMPALFAWISAGFGPSLESIALAPEAQLLEELEQAVEERRVPAFTSPSISEIVSELRNKVAWVQASDPSTSIGALLNLGAFSGPQAGDEKINFLRMYADRTGSVEDFWTNYRNHVVSSGASVDVDRLQTQLVLAGLTGQNDQLIDRLESQLGSGSIQSPRDFAQFDSSGWLAILDGSAVGAAPLAAPDDYPGDDADERRGQLAVALAHRFELVFPEVAIAYGLERAQPAGTIGEATIPEVAQYLRDHETLDLRRAVIKSYVQSDPANAASDELMAALEQVQRLYGVVEGYDLGAKIAHLSSVGVDSAQELISRPLQDLDNFHTPVFADRREILATYERASKVAKIVNQVVKASMTTLNPERWGIRRAARSDAGSPDAPTLEGLFGSFDHCACEHCQSVFSPSAYLVDLLAGLSLREMWALGCIAFPPDPDHPTFVAPPDEDLLWRFHRRPDICHIDLNCANTHTPLPFIDITNELLEERVLWANGLLDWSEPTPGNEETSGPALWDRRQTSWTADQLRAHPEHLDYNVYEILRSTDPQSAGGLNPGFASVRPWILPFDLFLSESRGYLELMGSSRLELLKTFTPEADDVITRELLQLNSSIYELIIDDRPPLEGNRSELELPRTMVWLGDPDHVATRFPRPTSLAGLQGIQDLLRATELRFLEFLVMHDSQFVARDRGQISPFVLEIPGDSDDIVGCDLEGAHILVPSIFPSPWPPYLARLHRFRRVMNATGLDIDELDECLQKLTLGGQLPELDPDTLAKLGKYLQQKQDFPRLSAMEALSWWGDIEARPTKKAFEGTTPIVKQTLYDTLFLAPDSHPDYRNDGNHVLAEFELLKVQDFDLVRHRAIESGEPIAEHIASSLRISSFELDELLAGIPLEPFRPHIPTDPPRLTVRNLSLIHLRVSIARQIGISPVELLRLESLLETPLSTPQTGTNHEVDHTQNWTTLVPEWQRLADAGWTVADLDFVLEDVLDDDARDYRQLAQLLADGLEALFAPELDFEDRATGENPLDILASELEIVAASGQGFQLDDIPSTLQAVAMDAELGGHAQWAAAINRLPRATFTATRPNCPAANDLYTCLDFGPGGVDEVDARALDLLREIGRSRGLDASYLLVEGRLHALFNLEIDIFSELSNASIPGGLVDHIARSDDFVGFDREQLAQWLALDSGAELVQEMSNVVVIEGWYRLLRRVRRAARTISAMGIEVQTLTWLLSLASSGLPVADEFEFMPLDVVPPGGTIGYEKLRKLLAFADFGHQLSGHFLGWRNFLDSSVGQLPADPVSVASLANAAADFDWDPVASGKLVTQLNFSWERLRDMKSLQGLIDALALTQTIAADVDDIYSWLVPGSDFDVSRAQVESMKAAAKSGYGSSDWANASGPTRDKLRMQQRDALRAYVLEYYEITGYLHDGVTEVPDPESVALTSVQRLESWMLHDNPVNPCRDTTRVREALSALQTLHFQRNYLDPSRDWERRYRLWEVQRKLSMYPENWLDPALRDDKTELFQDFEVALSAAPLAEAGIEAAFSGYLAGLDEIARLEIVGTVEERVYEGDMQTATVVHAFGRIRSKAGKLWHRTRIRDEIGARWTAWQQLPFETTSRDVLPFMYNGRLTIAWPRFERKTDADLDTKLDDQPDEHYEVRLSSVEFHNGRWREPQEARGYLVAAALNNGEQDSDLKNTSKRRSRRVARVVRRSLRNDSHKWARARKPSDIFLRSLVDPETGRLEIGVFFSVTGVYYHVGDFRYGRCAGGLESRAEHAFISVEDLGLVRPGPSHKVHGQRFAGSGRVALVRGWSPIFTSVPVRDHEVIISHDDGNLIGSQGFYQDELRTFYLERPSYGSYSSLRSGDAVELEAAVTGTPIAQLPVEAQSIWASRGRVTVDNPLVRRAESRVHAFGHPYVCLLRSQLERFGPDGLFQPALDGASDNVRGLVRQQLNHALFEDATQPGEEPFQAMSNLDGEEPRDEFQFDYGTAFAQYNWELFYHAPMMVAQRLMDDQQFEQAQHWLHHIFDPRRSTDDPNDVDYWKLKPFVEVPDSIESIIRGIAKGHSDDSTESFLAGISFLSAHPFQPFGVARLRPACFMRATVMMYLDNLLAWGDALFSQGTIESVAEATTLYGRVEQLLGPAPETLPVQGVGSASWRELANDLTNATTLGDIGNVMVDIENRLGFSNFARTTGGGEAAAPAFGQRAERTDANELRISVGRPSPRQAGIAGPAARMLNASGPVATGQNAQRTGQEFYAVPTASGNGKTLYFCVPPNQRMLDYWTTVGDRLHKVRYCLDLNGVPRNIRLFEPPIDPGAIVAALASGGNLQSALAQLDAPPPSHRFEVHLQQARAYTDTVIRLGSALESALISEDSETLSQLEADHSIALLSQEAAIFEARKRVAEAEIEGLEAAIEVAEDRVAHYSGLLSVGISDQEHAQSKLTEEARNLSMVASQIAAAAGPLAMIPTFEFGGKGSGTPMAVVGTGGFSFAGLLNAIASSVRGFSALIGANARRAGVQAGYERRKEDWQQQVDLANLDVARLKSEIEATRARIDIVQREEARHATQSEQAQAVSDFLQGKYSRPELYQWLAREIRKLYRRAFDVALTAAKRARQSLARELAGATDSIRLDGWNSANEGFRAGEKLRGELRALEHSYYNGRARELEITKQFSLARDNPGALLELQRTGLCDFDLTELHYDLDYPGHVLRRIQSVGLTVSSVRGPHTQVPAELTLVRSETRVLDGGQSQLQPDAVQSVARIATSGDVEDDGLFDHSNNDGRYLPFEHRGAISSWRLRLPECQRTFDYSTIGDVIVTIRYTARDGGEIERTRAEQALESRPLSSAGIEALHAHNWIDQSAQFWRGFSARTDFPANWLARAPGSGVIDLDVSLAKLNLKTADLASGLKLCCALIYEPGSTPPTTVQVLVNGGAQGIDAMQVAGQNQSTPTPPVRVGPATIQDAVVATLDPAGAVSTWSFEVEASGLPGLLDLLVYVQYAPLSN